MIDYEIVHREVVVILEVVSLPSRTTHPIDGISDDIEVEDHLYIP